MRIRPRGAFGRKATATAVLSAALLAGPLAAAASANVIYPTGCLQWTFSAWRTSCWVGSSYVNSSHSVTAIQRSSLGLGCSPSGIDGVFGQNTYTAVKCFQKKVGISVDGVVGTNTWAYYQAQLTNSVLSGGYFYFDVGTQHQAIAEGYTSGGNGYYYTKNNAGTAYPRLDVNAPS